MSTSNVPYAEQAKRPQYGNWPSGSKSNIFSSLAAIRISHWPPNQLKHPCNFKLTPYIQSNRASMDATQRNNAIERDPPHDIKTKLHFVLVHGASHGAWCWYKVQYLLQKAGHDVTAIDLAGAGISPVDPNTVLSFADYNRPLIEFLSTIPDSSKVVLVGHSAGGLSLTHAMNLFGQKISVAVYVCATMLPAGFLSQEDVRDGVPKLLTEYELKYGHGADHPPTSAIVRKELQRDLLYHLSPPEDATLASILLRPAPLLALQSARFERVNGGYTSFGKGVRRVYIKTLQDRILKAAQQEAMIKRWPPDEVLGLDCDHSPFFSASLKLRDLLVNVGYFYLHPNP